MTAPIHVAHDPWAYDDYQRRVMQHLFSDRISEQEKARRRTLREGLVHILEGILATDYDSLTHGNELIRDCFWGSQMPTKAHPADFDVVTDQPE